MEQYGNGFNATFLGKADLDAFIDSINLFSELDKLRDERTGDPFKYVMWGGNCAHNRTNGKNSKYEFQVSLAEGKMLDSYQSLKIPGLTNMPDWLCGVLYVLSTALARIAPHGQNWHNETARNGPEDATMFHLLKWGLDRFADRNDFSIVVASDWFRIRDYPKRSRLVHGRRQYSPLYIFDNAMPLGRDNGAVAIHQVKTEEEWCWIDKWLDATDCGTRPYDSATAASATTSKRCMP